MNAIATPPVAADAAPDNTVLFAIPGALDANGQPVSMQIDLATIPANVRLDALKAWVRDYVRNSVNQAGVRRDKDAATVAWTAYEAASASDPLQTAVPKPETAKPVLDLIPVATAARDRLYKGEVRKQGERRETVKTDPVSKFVTEAVVRELYDNTRKTDTKYKWTDATKAISEAGGGIAYLISKIETLVAAGGDRAALEKFMEARYVGPAKMMAGQTENKATKDMSLL